MGMGMGVNPYPPAYMGNPVGLFLCRGYGYGVVIPGGYLSIAISTHRAHPDLVGVAVLGCVWFGFWLWLLPPKSQKSNQRAESGKQLFLKADFLVVQN
jgi:hypothetical protein